jgi:cold shock CspA family protein
VIFAYHDDARATRKTVQRSYHVRSKVVRGELCVTLWSVAAILRPMVDELLNGRVTAFRREQGFGVITLDDGRDIKFDSSACTMVPEEGAVVRLRIGPARWGGGFKALHVEPRGSSRIVVPAPLPTLDEQIAALQGDHLVGSLTEHVMAQLDADVFGGRIAEAPLLDVLDAFYAADPDRARHDGYLRFAPPLPSAAEAVAAIAAVVPGLTLPRLTGPHAAGDIAAAVNGALEVAGDPRRLHALATGRDWRAYILLPADSARRLVKILPLV